VIRTILTLMIGAMLAFAVPTGSEAQISMPDNARLNAYGNGWVCINGFKNVAGACKEMTPKEAERNAPKVTGIHSGSFFGNITWANSVERLNYWD
jgi:hypothetical protein